MRRGREFVFLLLVAAALLSATARIHDNWTCSEDEFLCWNGQCIFTALPYNGKADRGDRSDEKNCSVSHCGPRGFQCRTAECITEHQVCDGHQDCAGGSDESTDLCKDEGGPGEDCTQLEFQCDSGQCIDFHSVCDNYADCSDKSDEANCNRNECLEKNGRCSHICRNLPLGYECDCPAGLELINHFICDDVDECKDSDLCSQHCVNLNGSYRCDCYNGYRKDSATSACEATGDEPVLIYTSGCEIRSISTSGIEARELVQSLDRVTAVSLDSHAARLYWTDVTGQSIFSKSIGGNTEDVTQTIGGLQTVSGIAVDWIYNHVYWTDSGAKTIELITLDGLKRKTIFSENLVEPAAVVVDPDSGFLYWSDVGKPTKIEKAGMNGVGRRILVNIGVEKPAGIALDTIKRRLYWVESDLNELLYTDLNGRQSTRVFHSEKHLANPFGLAVFEDRVYWTEQTNKAVYSANKFTGAGLTALAWNLTEPRGIAVFHKFMQPDGKNWCVSASPSCEYLCVPAPHTDVGSKYTCLCPDGMKLDATGYKCGSSTNSSGWPGQDTGQNALEETSLWLLLLVVGLTVSLMCCTAVCWRVILRCVKQSGCWYPVYLKPITNTRLSKEYTMDSSSQNELL
ncbi:very low-density lipoprotein receptor isoform X2 [Callorhinchus milii]|uniref:Very low-density lipoprotein receptor n=1 Tax=Callorhinchus milii TaxID=7868 RepID=V9KJT3_CALMI|nr:very low-density lipoprotein receptor isoform X2 [Callorhinchus milii]|eukprot:gi/632984942/ref/XP_007909403.1/ PREDICTED: very low-density lipoprotein receptor-like isoform X2 [Callorhinchus milii]